MATKSSVKIKRKSIDLGTKINIISAIENGAKQFCTYVVFQYIYLRRKSLNTYKTFPALKIRINEV